MFVFRRRCRGTDAGDFVQHFACVADAFGQVGAGVGEGFVEGVEHELVYLLAVAEADFCFGGVDVDVHGFGRQVEEGIYCDKAVCCIKSKIAAEIVMELLLLTTPRKISVTKNIGTKLKFIGF